MYRRNIEVLVYRHYMSARVIHSLKSVTTGWNPLHSIKTRRAAPDFQNAKTLEISAPTYRIPSESDKPESDTCNSGLYANTMELNAANIRNAKRSQPTSRPPRPRLAPFDFARTVISNSANENDSATHMTDQIYVNAGSSAPALPTKSDNDNCETLAGTTNSSINTNAYPSRTQFDDLQSSILSSLASDQLANQFQVGLKTQIGKERHRLNLRL